MKASFSKIDRKAIAYSLDACYPGFFIWIGDFSLRMGGEEPGDQPYPYPYTLPTSIGIGFVLPNLFVWHTPFSEFMRDSNNAVASSKTDDKAPA
ncbi:hypothetical protein [Pseudanabaena sp. PCC 6802]|uniref:hypothetical protein n=1 Tax=Pseudanabaena sp. PCC 6802 TaxID=118173 RepID=UPI0003606573|nr:hypothetical protein [Pseudanabaena sp. PCC 6802]